MSISLRKATIRLAYAVPALRQHLVPLLKSARQTTEPIRLKYTNLGDFGGTDPVIDSWVLEVAGPYEAMQALLPTLKKYKFQWNPSSRAWSIHASLYEYNNAKRQNFWNAARRNQEAAYPILKKLVDDYNRGAAAGNADLTGGNLTVKELQQKLQHSERQRNRLTEAGLLFDFEWPDRYSVAEAKTWVYGETFAIKDLMKRHGFMWGNGRRGKGWWMPTVEFAAVGDKWGNDVIRQLPSPVAPVGKAVFSEMTTAQLIKWLNPVVLSNMEANEYYDGEVDDREVLRGYMRQLPNLSPAKQQEFYDEWESGRMYSDFR